MKLTIIRYLFVLFLSYFFMAHFFKRTTQRNAINRRITFAETYIVSRLFSHHPPHAALSLHRPPRQPRGVSEPAAWARRMETTTLGVSFTYPFPGLVASEDDIFCGIFVLFPSFWLLVPISITIPNIFFSDDTPY